MPCRPPAEPSRAGGEPDQSTQSLHRCDIIIIGGRIGAGWWRAVWCRAECTRCPTASRGDGAFWEASVADSAVGVWCLGAGGEMLDRGPGGASPLTLHPVRLSGHPRWSHEPLRGWKKQCTVQRRPTSRRRCEGRCEGRARWAWVSGSSWRCREWVCAGWAVWAKPGGSRLADRRR